MDMTTTRAHEKVLPYFFMDNLWRLHPTPGETFHVFNGDMIGVKR